ncbi:MAG: divalent-cation tolerance protein CutA [Leptolyngbyaceae cyanobacterium bins.59]|nr:divalent-cation tolerance protein CutA [Leptolyngbyaceae cyanobacterium bins.59]
MNQAPDQGQYGVVLVTASSQTEAETIAESLVQSGLAACVNLFPVRSIYTWKGVVERSEEWQLLIKTTQDQFESLAKQVRTLHSYEVPEIILLPIVSGSEPYLRWISEQTHR